MVGGGAAPASAAGASAAVSPAEQELRRLRAAFTVCEGNPEYRFRRLLLDLDEGGALRARGMPGGVDRRLWSEALQEAQQLGELEGLEGALWPRPVGLDTSGFAGLQARLKEQDVASEAFSKFLLDCRQRLLELQQSHEAQVLSRLRACRREQERQRHRLVLLMRRVDFLEGRPFRRNLVVKEESLGRKLRDLALELQRGTASLPGRVEAVAATARMHFPMRRADPGELPLEKEALPEVHLILADCTRALQELEATILKDKRDLDIVARHAHQRSLPLMR